MKIIFEWLFRRSTIDELQQELEFWRESYYRVCRKDNR